MKQAKVKRLHSILSDKVYKQVYKELNGNSCMYEMGKKYGLCYGSMYAIFTKKYKTDYKSQRHFGLGLEPKTEYYTEEELLKDIVYDPKDLTGDELNMYAAL